MFPRPNAVAFDVIGTLFSREPLRARLTDIGLPSYILELWFARILRDAFALAASGVYRPFLDVARGTLASLLVQHSRPPESDQIEGVVKGFSSLPAHPDAGPAMKMLRANKVCVLALTNGSTKNTEALLKEAGLDDCVETVISIDDVKAWKPRPEVYQHAARVAGCDLGRLALVAAHAWDCQGATRAGLITGWVSRSEKVFNPVFGRPDVQSDDLTGVIEQLLRNPSE